MINRENLISALKAHSFQTHGIILHIDVMNAPTSPYPFVLNVPIVREIAATSRKLDNRPIIDQCIEEIQMDLDVRHHSDASHRIVEYGVYYYQVLSQETSPIIRYAKAVRCINDESFS